ncbi:acyl-CoA thioesterase [Tahibacter aquaticus]|uniref:Acyl-CoA thioesterase n=1 Tax=Tahibacter aquaticus TaxID=520092 RepID=A0A4R6YII0_9GAMM|nr:thioesterase family protein [Tahibacter aquaticus]TDR36680.1 acyl-CoA thioesterase [Tahibacter aquaticus]
MKLSELMRSAVRDEGRLSLQVGDDWLQGRSVFGGLQAAIALAAMRSCVAAELPLRTLQMTFIAPIPGGTVRAAAQLLRSGKSAVHVQARLEDEDGGLLALVIGVFGSARESRVQRSVESVAAIPGPPPTPLPFMPGVTPNFMQHFKVELSAGALPFTNTPVTRNVFKVGLRDDGGMSESHLLALADFVPPVALSWMDGVSPGSSLTWMLELLVDSYADQPLTGWQVDAEMVAARDGYTSQSTTISAPDGRVVALSRQTMVVFA